MTDIETTRKHEAEMKQAFAKMFPLVDEIQLPWAARQIQAFLMQRIQLEVKLQVGGFVNGVSKVLCEVTQPKNHIVDMCRNVVSEIESLRIFVEYVESRAKDLASMEMTNDEQKSLAINILKQVEKVRQKRIQ